MEELNIRVGKKLSSLRKKAGMSRQDVAKRLDVTYGYIARIESGTSGVSSETLIRFARLYKSSTDYILGLDATKKEVVREPSLKIMSIYLLLPRDDQMLVDNTDKTLYDMMIAKHKDNPKFRERLVEDRI